MMENLSKESMFYKKLLGFGLILTNPIGIGIIVILPKNQTMR